VEPGEAGVGRLLAVVHSRATKPCSTAASWLTLKPSVCWVASTGRPTARGRAHTTPARAVRSAHRRGRHGRLAKAVPAAVWFGGRFARQACNGTACRPASAARTCPAAGRREAQLLHRLQPQPRQQQGTVGRPARIGAGSRHRPAPARTTTPSRRRAPRRSSGAGRRGRCGPVGGRSPGRPAGRRPRPAWRQGRRSRLEAAARARELSLDRPSDGGRR
jgi:hypothetical protein